MKINLFAIVMMIAGLARLGAQAVERPAGPDSRAYLSARQHDLASKGQQIQTEEREYQAASEAARIHPTDLHARLQEAGEHVRLLNLLLDREEIEINYLTLEAKAASDLADRLAAGTRDENLDRQITDLSGKLAESKSQLRALLDAGQQSQDANSTQRLNDAVSQAEALQSSLQLFQRARQREDDAQKDRAERVARLRAAAAGTQRAAESHGYRKIAIKATMAARMVDVRSAGEELQSHDVEEAVKTMVGSESDDPLAQKYVLHPEAIPSGSIEDRARRLLDETKAVNPSVPSTGDIAKPGSDQQ